MEGQPAEVLPGTLTEHTFPGLSNTLCCPKDFSSRREDFENSSLCAGLQAAPSDLPWADHAVAGSDDCGRSRGALGPIALQTPSGFSFTPLGLQEVFSGSAGKNTRREFSRSRLVGAARTSAEREGLDTTFPG